MAKYQTNCPIKAYTLPQKQEQHRHQIQCLSDSDFPYKNEAKSVLFQFYFYRENCSNYVVVQTVFSPKTVYVHAVCYCSMRIKLSLLVWRRVLNVVVIKELFGSFKYLLGNLLIS
jgi:hypothetical protein